MWQFTQMLHMQTVGWRYNKCMFPNQLKCRLLVEIAIFQCSSSESKTQNKALTTLPKQVQTEYYISFKCELDETNSCQEKRFFDALVSNMT